MAKLASQQVPVVFSGLHGSRDPKYAIPGELAVASNLVSDKQGSFRSRRGFSNIPLPPSGTVHTIFENSGKLWALTQSKAFFLDNGNWIEAPAPKSLGLIDQSTVFRTLPEVCEPNEVFNGLAQTGGYELHTASTSKSASSKTSLRVQDSDGNTVFEELIALPMLRCASSGQHLFAVGFEIVSSSVVNIFFISFDTAFAPGTKVQTSHTLTVLPEIETWPALAQFDIAWDEDRNSLWVTYFARTTKNIVIAEYKPITGTLSSVVQHTRSLGDETRGISCGYHPSGEDLYIAWGSSSNGLRVLTADLSDPTAVTLGAETAITLPAGTSVWNHSFTPNQSNMLCTFSYQGNADGLAKTDVYSFSSPTVKNLVSSVDGLVVTKTVVIDSEPHFVVCGGNSPTTETLIKGGETVAVFSNHSPGLGRYGGLREAFNSSGVFVYTSLEVSDPISLGNGNFDFSYTVNRLTFTVGSGLSTVKVGEATLIASGALLYCDGDWLSHLTPSTSPSIKNSDWIIPGGTGWFPKTSDNFVFSVREEWKDSLGLKHRSQHSPLYRISPDDGDGSTAGYGLIFYNTANTTHTEGESARRFFTYRTRDDAQTLQLAKIETSRNVAQVTINDTDLADNPILSITELQPVSIAKPLILATSGDRVWSVNTDRSVINYSKLQQPGIAPEFAEELEVPLPLRNGAITGIVDLDGTPIVFVEDAIFVILGGGPDNNGQAGDFVAERIVGDIGCIETRSLVSTPQGIWFLSKKGFRLLDRTRNIVRTESSFLGSEIEDVLADITAVTAVVHTPSKSQILWAVDSVTHGFISYNYEQNIWTSYTKPVGKTPKQMCTVNGILHVLASDGSLSFEDEFQDFGSHFPLVLRTRPLAFAGLEGFQRVREVHVSLRNKGTFTLVLRMRKDDQTAFTFVKSFPFLVQPQRESSVSVTVPHNLQKCSRMEIEIEVSVTDGEPCEILGISLDVGLKVGGAKYNVSNRR